MGIVRNFINIEGLIEEENIPSEINGQIIRYSEVETLYIPNEKPEVKNIYEIAINVEVKSSRTIYAPSIKIVVIDGVKIYKIIYTENTESDKANILYLKVPYNTFIELPKGVENVSDIKVHIIDAYFDLLDTRKIYGHFVYLVDVTHDKKDSIDKSIKEKCLLEESVYTDTTIQELSVSEENIRKESKDVFVDLDEEIL